MSVSSQLDVPSDRSTVGQHVGPRHADQTPDRQLIRWGGVAALAGVGSLLGSVAVVAVLGLPDASDVETLTDFANIKSGRIGEHVLYLAALVLFALHILVLHRLLTTAHQAAALFGAAVAEFGLLIMAASSMLHLSTAPLADLYSAPGANSADLQAIEYAWHGAQSVFDTMLVTGVLLVPIGIVLLGIAMRSAPAFGNRIALFAIGLGILGIIGAGVAIVDPGSMMAAVSVLAIAVFHLATGWRTLRLASETTSRP